MMGGVGCQSSFHDQAKLKFLVSTMGGPSFLALVHHPNLRLSVSTGFHIGHHKGLSHKRPISF